MINLKTNEKIKTMVKAIVNLVTLQEGEKATAYIPIKTFDDTHYLIMATKDETRKNKQMVIL